MSLDAPVERQDRAGTTFGERVADATGVDIEDRTDSVCVQAGVDVQVNVDGLDQTRRGDRVAGRYVVAGRSAEP